MEKEKIVSASPMRWEPATLLHTIFAAEGYLQISETVPRAPLQQPGTGLGHGCGPILEAIPAGAPGTGLRSDNSIELPSSRPHLSAKRRTLPEKRFNYFPHKKRVVMNPYIAASTANSIGNSFFFETLLALPYNLPHKWVIP